MEGHIRQAPYNVLCCMNQRKVLDCETCAQSLKLKSKVKTSMGDLAPSPTRHYKTTLIPVQETVSWKIHNVSDLLQTNAWTAVTIPMEAGLGPAELSRWNISLVSRNNNSVLCARTILLSPQESHRRVTHNLRVAVVVPEGEDKGPVYYFPNPTNNSNANTSTVNANLRHTNRDNNEQNRCMKNLRRLFVKNAKLDEDDELGDGTSAKEARPGHKGHPSLWKVIPIQSIVPDLDDCIELRVTLTVYGCDSVMDE